MTVDELSVLSSLQLGILFLSFFWHEPARLCNQVVRFGLHGTGCAILCIVVVIGTMWMQQSIFRMALSALLLL